MFVLDRLLVGGIGFVLDKIARSVDSELHDVDRIREELLALQMQLELGEIGEDEFADLETELLARLRGLRDSGPIGGDHGDTRVEGVEVSFDGDPHDEDVP